MSLVIFLLVVLGVLYVVKISSGDFQKEKTYILTEIERAGSEDEKTYWKKMLRKLYLESIPVIGFILS
ncbi:MAG: hypothetical protein IJ300_05095 [Clostridia bacterium]|nr:hypothetical protein [Clostridia bacterium]